MLFCGNKPPFGGRSPRPQNIETALMTEKPDTLHQGPSDSSIPSP